MKPNYPSKAAVARLASVAEHIGIDIRSGGVEFGPDGTIRFLPPKPRTENAFDRWENDL